MAIFDTLPRQTPSEPTYIAYKFDEIVLDNGANSETSAYNNATSTSDAARKRKGKKNKDHKTNESSRQSKVEETSNEKDADQLTNLVCNIAEKNGFSASSFDPTSMKPEETVSIITSRLKSE